MALGQAVGRRRTARPTRSRPKEPLGPKPTQGPAKALVAIALHVTPVPYYLGMKHPVTRYPSVSLTPVLNWRVRRPASAVDAGLHLWARPSRPTLHALTLDRLLVRAQT